MAVFGGQFLHLGNQYVIDRIQTGGVSNFTQNEERIYELGNYQSVARVKDIPDLTFDVESVDMSCEFEAILTNQDPTSLVNGQEFDFANAVPMSVISPFKSSKGQFDAIRGVAVPYLNLENVTYRFGLRQNATQSFSLRGDSFYYTPGAPYYEEFTNTGDTTYNFANTAIVYNEGGDTIYALGAMLKDSTTNAFRRLYLGDDFTNTSSGITLLEDLSGTYDTLCVVYSSTTPDNYPQSVHQGVSIKPAAVRGKDIDVYIGTSAATPTFSRWTSVQSVEVTRSVTIENDEEFGNYRYVASEYDIPEVTGNMVIRPRDVVELWDKVALIADVPNNEVVGPFTSVFLPVEIRISSPDTGAVIKTLYIPDARFDLPPLQGTANSKLDLTVNFSSDGGTLLVYNGTR